MEKEHTLMMDRRSWLKRFGVTVSMVGVGITTMPERAEAMGSGAELVALNMLNPQVRKAAGRYKKVLLGGVSALLSAAAVGVKKLDEMTDTLLGAELGEITEKVSKKRQTVDGGHWQYASHLLPYLNEVIPPSQSIVKEFSLGMKRFLAPAAPASVTGFDPIFSDYNERELLYTLTVEPKESINKLSERPIFPSGRRLVIKSDDQDAVGALAKSLLNNVKSDELKKLVAKEYKLGYVRPMFAGGLQVNGIGFNHVSNEPAKSIFWVVDHSSFEALNRTVLLDRLLANALAS